MIDKVKNIIIVLFSIMLFIALQKTCNKPTEIFKPEVISKTINIDSVRTHYERHIDSTKTWIHKSYSEVPEIKKDGTEVKYIFVDNSDLEEGMIDLSDTSVFESDIDTFYYGKKDSTLRYNIRVYSSVKPEKLEMEYSVLNLATRDSIYVRDSINIKETEKVRVNQVYLGFETNFMPQINRPFLTLDVVSKKGWMYGGGLGYGFNDQQYYIKGKIAKLISFRKKYRKK